MSATPNAPATDLFGPDMFFKLAESPSTFDLLGDFELVTILLSVQTSPGSFNLDASDARMDRVMRVLGLPRTPTDALARAFGPEMISRLATNPATLPLIQAYDFFTRLTAVQNDVTLLPDHMGDPRMGKALVALLQETVYSMPTAAIPTMEELVARILAEPENEWPLWGDYVLVAELVHLSS
ncbi:hypothetical protein As57867_005404, partial [Aphanomyces stellatus]